MPERPLTAQDIRRICAGVHFTGVMKPLAWLMHALLKLPDAQLVEDVKVHARDQFGIADITVDDTHNTVVLHYKNRSDA